MWTPAFNADKGKITNLGLTQQWPALCPHCICFLGICHVLFWLIRSDSYLVPLCSGKLWIIALWWDLVSEGLDLLVDPSARSQFRHRHISFQMWHAVAKAIVMRLLAVPWLPRPFFACSETPWHGWFFAQASFFPISHLRLLSFVFFFSFVIFLFLPSSLPPFLPLSSPPLHFN